jgi:CheY-like chemotaxis protein
MSTSYTRTPRRILVADDDPVARLLVTSVLKKEGYTPVAVADGCEALCVLKSDSDFGAAIFNVLMPRLGVVEIIRHMKTERRLMRIPVMLITSECGLKLMAESFAAGATVFLPKPFTASQLLLLLRMLLDKSARAAALAAKAQMITERPAAAGTRRF